MEQRQIDSTVRRRCAALAVLAAGAISACAARQTNGLPSTALAHAPDDTVRGLIECVRTETARLGYQPVSNQARAVTRYYDVEHAEDALWFVAQRIGPAPGSVVIVAEARRDRTGRPVLLATAEQLDYSSQTTAWENSTTIRRSISGASSHGTVPVRTPLPAVIRAEVDSLRSACASPPTQDFPVQSPLRSSR